MSARIRPLPSNLVAQIKSTITIASLEDAVIGLIKNSLDAAATNININVAFRKGSCVIEDDGIGISPADFEENGGLGRMHYTSKCLTDEETYGQTGSFLAGLASLSLFTITSQHRDYRSQNSLIFHQGTTISRLLPAPPEHELRSFGHGTRVYVRDLFSNLPVRIKQRSIKHESHTAIAREWASLRREIVSLALFAPREANISLVCEENAEKLSIRRSVKDGGPDRWLSILSQSQYINPDDFSSWATVSASTSSLELKGAISLVPSASKNSQFIAFGFIPLSWEVGKMLYDDINQMFSKSSFGAFDQDGIEGVRKRSKSLQKGLEKWPRFVLQISFLQSQGKLPRQDILSDSRLINSIFALVNLAAHEFLKRHDFERRVKIAADNDAVESSNHRSPKSLNEPGTPRQKRPFSDDHTEFGSDFPLLPTFNTRPMADVSRPLSRARVGSAQPQLSQNTLYVNTVTGGITESAEPFLGFQQNTGSANVTNHHKLQWLEDLSKTWQNPGFQQGEEPIRQINNGSNTSVGFEPRSSQSANGHALNTFHQMGLAKQDLSAAQVISQVDTKFILIKIQDHTTTDDKLILIDQHAADERCKLEQLLRQLCLPSPESNIQSSLGLSSRIETVPLPDTIAISLSEAEYSLCVSHAPHLARWGILYNLDPLSSAPQTLIHEWKISVIALPSAIAQRCLSDHELLRKCLRGEIWRLENQKSDPLSRQEQFPSDDWVRDIADCPTFLINLLSSRACRSKFDETDISNQALSCLMMS